MLENIISLIKECAQDAVNKEKNVMYMQKDLVIAITTSSFANELKRQLTSCNKISEISLIFTNVDMNQMLNKTLKHSITNSLINKIHLSTGTAINIANNTVDSVITLLTNNINNSADANISIINLIQAFTTKRRNYSKKRSNFSHNFIDKISLIFR